MKTLLRSAAAAFASAMLMAGAAFASGESDKVDSEKGASETWITGIEFSGISGDPEKPRRHMRVRNAAELTREEAEEIYEALAPEMAAGYRKSGDPVAMAYRGWQLYNAAPYRSATHGQRFVNNHANDIAQAYGRYESAGTLPVGSAITKESFTVTTDGAVVPGPLFIMEKMPAGFNYVTGDWRYTMIGEAGEVFGVTKGANAERVEYCIACHLARERYDHLYFVPTEYRVMP